MVFVPRKGKGARKSRVARRKGAPATKKSVVKLVKSVMASEIETKFVSQTVANTSFNSEITNADIIQLLPAIQQMDSSNVGSAWQRNGTKISPKSLTFNCQWQITPVNRSLAVVVHYFILVSKQYKSASALSGVTMGRLLRSGATSLYEPFNGYINNSFLPVNEEEFTVIKRGHFLLYKNTGDVQDSTTAGNQPIVAPVCKIMKFRIPVPAKLTYDQDSSLPRTVLYPNGYAPFMVFGYTHQDGTVPDMANQDVTLTARSQMWFDDA